jgi:hypothetical protein
MDAMMLPNDVVEAAAMIASRDTHPTGSVAA